MALLFFIPPRPRKRTEFKFHPTVCDANKYPVQQKDKQEEYRRYKRCLTPRPKKILAEFPGKDLKIPDIRKRPASGSSSEAQLRFINGHFPEDFATACRNVLAK